MKKIIELAQIFLSMCVQTWSYDKDTGRELAQALEKRIALEQTPITEEWLKEHGFVQNEYRGYEYDLTMDEGRTEIRYYRSGGEPDSTMAVYKNIDFEDEVCYELPEPYFVAQLLDALELCDIKID